MESGEHLNWSDYSPVDAALPSRDADHPFPGDNNNHLLLSSTSGHISSSRASATSLPSSPATAAPRSSAVILIQTALQADHSVAIPDSSSYTISSQPAPSPSLQLSTPSKFFISVVIIESVILVATALVALLFVYHDTQSRADGENVSAAVINTALVALTSTVGFLYFAIDSVRLQHKFQLYASICAHCTILLYVIVHYRSKDLGDWFGSVSLYILILVSVAQIILLILSKFVVDSFGRRMFQRLRNGRPEMVAIYTQQEIFFSLLRMDLFLQILLLMLAAFFVTRPKLMPVSISALVLTILCFAAGFTGVRRESKLRMRWFLFFGALPPFIFCWMAVDVYHDSKLYPQFTFEQFMITAALAFLCRVALLYLAYVCTSNFGKGLKERLWAPVATHSDSINSPQTVRPNVMRVTRVNEMTSFTPVGSFTDHSSHAHLAQSGITPNMNFPAGSQHRLPQSSASSSPDSPITGSLGSSYMRASANAAALALNPHDDSIVQHGESSNTRNGAALVPTQWRHSNLFGAHRSWNVSASSDPAVAQEEAVDSLEESSSQRLKQQLLQHRQESEMNDHDAAYSSYQPPTHLAHAHEVGNSNVL